ncbi:hypothetical protein GALMADRAFT_148555 [Galerina marginata CBS 339.88]|uniref:Uncharacterized protein n=1 Tax=Galerina marginata (strain CBS 339.88) TaxID=685588 RepID=A0A067S6S5_GALM3|nr:hypothetical protein GALMADRAFT_148555 [Galerina marginata CBS 339.88]
MSTEHLKAGFCLIDGNWYFSPNSSRKPKLPISNPNSDNLIQNDSPLSVFQNPQWWNLAWGWQSFVPLKYDFDDELSKMLRYIPRCDFDESKGYFMPYDIAVQWSQLESDLYATVIALKGYYTAPSFMPCAPRAAGYLRAFKYHSTCTKAMYRSRDWFQIWLGYLRYIIASANSDELSSEPYALRAKLDWYSYLKQEGFNLHWLDVLYTSSIFSRAVPRAGIFIKLPNDGLYQPSPHWFISNNIEVWYPWGPEQMKIEHIQHYGPQIDHNQESTTVFEIPYPQLVPHDAEKPWEQFFATRNLRNAHQSLFENDFEKQCRKHRINNPPSTAKVFVWERDYNNRIVRQVVPVNQREMIQQHGRYNNSYYDSFTNECDYFDEFFEDDISTLDDLDNGTCFYELNEDIDPKPIAEKIEVHTELHNSGYYFQRYEGSIDEIINTLKLYFGYTQPKREYRELPVSDEKKIKKFLRILGIPIKIISDGVFKEQEIKEAVDFVFRLAEDNVHKEEWDLGTSGTQGLIIHPRLKYLRIMHIPIPDTSDYQTFFMFDFKDKATVKWNLTVYSAYHAMIICRLDPNMNEEDIALFLLGNGMLFRTFRLKSTLEYKEDRYTPPAVPTTENKRKFEYEDYQSSIQRAHAVLAHNPRGRAALMEGGYLWRIALDNISFETVLAGPLYYTVNSLYFRVPNCPEEEYVDDVLPEDEGKTVLGEYIVKDPGQHDMIMSWYPPENVQHKAGDNHCRWTAIAEDLFQHRHNKIKTNPVPFRRKTWTASKRSVKNHRDAMDNLHKHSYDYIAEILNLKK